MEETVDYNQPLLVMRPSWWNYFWNFVFFWLFFPLIAALIKRYSLKAIVYPDKVVLEKGILSKDIVELFISDIRAINVKQTIMQRIFGIGDLYIATAGTQGYEERAYGIKNPHKAKELIMNLRRRVKNP